MKTWYATKSGNDYQGQVVEEGTGKTIAVSYDHKDTALLASAPDLLQALQAVMDDNHKLGAISRPSGDMARAAINKALGK